MHMYLHLTSIHVIYENLDLGLSIARAASRYRDRDRGYKSSEF